MIAFRALRIVSWNCNGALRKKLHALEPLGADVLLVQECEDPARATDDAYLKWAGNYLWAGSTKNKGIGVFVREGITLERVALDMSSLRLFLPCLVDGAPLLATWTQRANSPTFPYIGQLWKFLQWHKDFLRSPQALLVGDFNSNVRWDVWDRWWNHSDVVGELRDVGLCSAYHEHRSIQQGNEPDPTFYMHQNIQKPYHIDYAFVGHAWKVDDVQVGQASEWLVHSDHMPLIVDTGRVGRVG